MKILIITFTGGVNPGTIMQALGVQEACKQMFPNAQIDFLKFPDFKRSIMGLKAGKDSMLDTIKRKAMAAYRLTKYNKTRNGYLKYTKTIDLFSYSKDDIDFIKLYDLVVIGSDTILEKAYNESGTIGLNWMPIDVNKIYFAASASPARISPKEELKEVASKATFIGLRDNLTIDFFRNSLGIDALRLTKQPDPSYFLDITKFRPSKSVTNKLQTDKKYALFNFAAGFTQRGILADKLRELGYTVVTTAYSPDADISLSTLGPFEWAAVFPMIDIVVTERFHDSVFGLRNCKPVIAIDWDEKRFGASGDSKTYRILEDYGLTSLHFNLRNSSNLSAVVDAIKNIDDLFDKSKIEARNKEIRMRANEILCEIKERI